ncbi:MAG TPA: hypothetical protein VGI60_03610 [Chthoniobacterales bacterium]|jgi:hypothetical protein
MTTIFSLSDTPSVSDSSAIGAILLEPLFLIAACLFWLIVLPLGGLFCAAVSLYDRLAGEHPRPIHTAAVLRHSSSNPFGFRQSSLRFREGKDSSARISGGAQA